MHFSNSIANKSYDNHTNPSSSIVNETDIAILIPTMNRSHFLTRALTYYKEVGFGGYICIGDSSSKAEMQNNIEAIRSVSAELNVIYSYFPKQLYTNDSHCMQKLIEIAPPRYLVYSGDDDLLVPTGLVKCATFLAGNPDYSAAHGIRICTKLNREGAYGDIEDVYFVPEHILENDSASHRLAGYIFSSNSTQYYVHRKETWRRMYTKVSSIKTRYIGPELLPCSLSAILGKVKFIDSLTTIFQSQDERPFSWDTTSIYSLMLSSEWSDSISVVREDLANALSNAESLTFETAQKNIDALLFIHLSSMLSWQYINAYPNYQAENMPCLLDFKNMEQELIGILFGDSWQSFLTYLNHTARKEISSAGQNVTESLLHQVVWFNIYGLYKYACEKVYLSQEHEIYELKDMLTNNYGNLSSEDNPIISELEKISLISYQSRQ